MRARTPMPTSANWMNSPVNSTRRNSPSTQLQELWLRISATGQDWQIMFINLEENIERGLAEMDSDDQAAYDCETAAHRPLLRHAIGSSRLAWFLFDWDECLCASCASQFSVDSVLTDKSSRSFKERDGVVWRRGQRFPPHIADVKRELREQLAANPHYRGTYNNPRKIPFHALVLSERRKCDSCETEVGNV